MYNVVIIGGGTAGLVTAAGTAGLGGRVALIEKHRMGGDCLNTGCVPSKALLASARHAHEMRHAERWGLPSPSFEIALGPVLERMRARRAALAPHDSEERFRSLGVDVIRGAARFLSPREVEVEGQRLRARNFVIATGGRPALPPIPGLAESQPFTNETVFDALPPATRRLLVLGGGPIGCELSQAFVRLGLEVTLLEASSRLLEKEDEEAGGLIRGTLEAEGVRVVTGAKVQGVVREGSTTRVTYEHEGVSSTLEGDALLVAAGRVANVDGLGLADAGVAYDARGIHVDSHLRTARPHIYAAGDVVRGPQFTHLADHHARVIVRNILVPWFPVSVDTRVVPRCTYTDPEVAQVGDTEGELRKKGISHAVQRVAQSAVDRAVLEGREDGFVKVMTDEGGDRILGATIVGAHAGEVLHELVLAMKTGVGLSAIAATIHAYPTFAEASRKAADQAQKQRLTPLVRRVFSALYRWHRRGAM